MLCYAKCYLFKALTYIKKIMAWLSSVINGFIWIISLLLLNFSHKHRASLNKHVILKVYYVTFNRRILGYCECQHKLRLIMLVPLWIYSICVLDFSGNTAISKTCIVYKITCRLISESCHWDVVFHYICNQNGIQDKWRSTHKHFKSVCTHLKKSFHMFLKNTQINIAYFSAGVN